jgi:hypothetical protein
MDQYVFDLENELTTKLVVRIHNLAQSGAGTLKRRRDFNYVNAAVESYSPPVIQISPQQVLQTSSTPLIAPASYFTTGPTLPIPQESNPCDTILITHLQVNTPDSFIVSLLQGYVGMFMISGLIFFNKVLSAIKVKRNYFEEHLHIL